MSKRELIMAALILLLVGLLAGLGIASCTGGDDDTDTAADATTVETAGLASRGGAAGA